MKYFRLDQRPEWAVVDAKPTAIGYLVGQLTFVVDGVLCARSSRVGDSDSLCFIISWYLRILET